MVTRAEILKEQENEICQVYFTLEYAIDKDLRKYYPFGFTFLLPESCHPKTTEKLLLKYKDWNPKETYFQNKKALIFPGDLTT